MDAMEFCQRCGTNVLSPHEHEGLATIAVDQPAHCVTCNKFHYGSTPCPYKPKEARTVRVRIGVGCYENGIRVQEVGLFYDTDDKALAFVRASQHLGALLGTAIIEADIPITEPVTIKAEVVQ